eukprot:EG_transcript_4418
MSTAESSKHQKVKKKQKPDGDGNAAAPPVQEEPAAAAEQGADQVHGIPDHLRDRKRKKSKWAKEMRRKERQRQEGGEAQTPARAPWEDLPLEPGQTTVKPFTVGREIGYFSPKRFEDQGLCEPVWESLKQARPKCTNLTEPQVAILPALLDPAADTLVYAKDHTGRSLAYLIALMTAIGPTKPHPEKPFALILTPEHKRAHHIRDELVAVSGIRRATPLVLTQFRTLENDQARFSVSPHVVICHPRRMMDHIRQSPSMGDWLDDARFVVADQLDVLLREGYAEDISALLQNLSHSDRKLILVSAEESKVVQEFATRHLRKGYAVACGVPERERSLKQKTHQECLVVKPAELPLTLMTLLKELKRKGKQKLLVYCAVAEEAVYYAALAREVIGVEPIEMHSLRQPPLHPLDQEGRRAIFERLKTEESWVCFTMDCNKNSWTKGNFIPGPLATVVLHVGAPPHAEKYVHRLGDGKSTDQLAPKSIILGLPFEEMFLSNLATQFRVDSIARPVPKPKFVEKVEAALQRRALTDATPQAKREAEFTWKSWLGYKKSMRQTLGCTNELMVANGNQLFATLFADPHGNAPAVSWSWACQMNLRRQDTLNCSQRGMPRVERVELWSDDEKMDPEEKKKRDLLALVRKLKEGARFKPRDPDAPRRKRKKQDDEGDDEDEDSDED